MKVAMFIHGSGYEKNQVLAAKEAGILVFAPFKKGIIKKIFRLHNANPLNKKFELPFKPLWFRRLLKGMDINKEDDIYFLFYESFNISYSAKFLSYLKKRFPTSRNYFIFTNPPDEYNTSRVTGVRHLYDFIVSDVKDLAEKNGYLFYPFNPMSFPRESLKSNYNSDVFFVGADKGRLPILLSIFELLQANGLKCDFNIVGVPAEKQRYANQISYNHPLSYDEVIKRILQSKCVLEIVQKGLNYYTFRVTEAMLMHKKLISTNTELSNDTIFNDKILKTFSLSDPIKNDWVDFINQQVEDKDFPDSSYWSFQRFIEFLSQSE